VAANCVWIAFLYLAVAAGLHSADTRLGGDATTRSGAQNSQPTLRLAQ
jgi:hypothetical protein